MRKQRGISMFGLLIVCIVIVLVAIGGLKIAPAYIEYFHIKKAVAGIMQSGDARRGTVADIRAAFERRRAIDDFDAVSGRDLEITKEGNEVVVTFAYPKKIPIFANVSVLIDFSGSSQQ
jgi:hypothetical protein